jgi:hypothetical protein
VQHVWEDDGLERRGERWITTLRCKNCDLTMQRATENGIALTEEPEFVDCDTYEVAKVMEETGS